MESEILGPNAAGGVMKLTPFQRLLQMERELTSLRTRLRVLEDQLRAARLQAQIAQESSERAWRVSLGYRGRS